MKKVWQCGFCSHTHKFYSEIENHEVNCSFNPINKKCYSCKYHDDWGQYGSSYSVCLLKEKGLANYDVIDGEEDGNCEGWFTRDKKLLRKLKLQKLKNI